MKNPATQNYEGLNQFTNFVKNSHGNIHVKLRNDMIVKPLWKEAESEYETSCFHTENWNFCWDENGKSITSRDFDMMEIWTE